MHRIKFIHAADLHLDTPFTGLSQWNPELAGKLKNATFGSFDRIVRLCIDEEADFLLVAGDIFNSKNQSLAAQLKFVGGLQTLADRGIPCYFVCGNHDPLSSWMTRLQLPPGVHRFGGKEVETVTFRKNDRALADIYGISFETEAVTSNLARKIIHSRMGKADPAPFQLALMHGTVGQAGPHKHYAPFSLEEVGGQKFDYWALGHVHKRQVLRVQNPAVVYPGNPQGRDFGETGSRGCCIVELREGTAPDIRFAPTHTIRFEALEVELTNTETIDAIPERIEDARRTLEDHDENINLVLRLALKGQTALHAKLNEPGEAEQLLQLLNEGQLNQEPFTWYDSIRLQTSPALNLESIRQGNDFPAEILKRAEALAGDTAELDAFLKVAQEEFGNPQIRRELAELSAAERAELVEKAKWMLLEYLSPEGE